MVKGVCGEMDVVKGLCERGCVLGLSRVCVVDPFQTQRQKP